MVTVTVKTPKGYRPRHTQIRSAVFSSSSSYKSEAERITCDIVKDAYAKYEGLGLKFQVSSVTTQVSIVFTDRDENKATGEVIVEQEADNTGETFKE
jgi:hypothetical protein